MFWTLLSSSLRAVRICSPKLSHRGLSFTPNYRFPRVPKIPKRDPPPVPSFREQVARANVVKSFSEEVKYPSTRNQILFFTVGSLLVFTLAAEQANTDTSYWSRRLSGSGSLVWKVRSPTSEELRRVRYHEFGKKLQAGLATLKDTVEQWPNTIRSIAVWSYIQFAQPILDVTEGKRVCWAIGAFNTAIWIAWQIPRIRPFMMTHFTHNPLSGKSYTMLTSMFSHKSVLHLIFNSMAMASFGSAASQYLMKEQGQGPTGLPEASVKWHFLAFFVSAGLFSGLASHAVAARIHFPQLVQKLVQSSSSTGTAAGALGGAVKETATNSILPSLGASGAIYGTVTLTALAFPDTEIALLIPPTFPIPIQWGVGGILALDIVGALRGWRMFDHWAHLGGAAFGVLYYNYGPRFWDVMRVANLKAIPSSQIKSKNDL